MHVCAMHALQATCTCILSHSMLRAGSTTALGEGQLHLGAADDGGKRPVRLLDGVIQVVQIVRQPEARVTPQKVGDTCITADQSTMHPVNLGLKIGVRHGCGIAFVCHTFCGCMSAMRKSRGIVHKDFCYGCQLQRHHCQTAATMPFIWLWQRTLPMPVKPSPNQWTLAGFA